MAYELVRTIIQKVLQDKILLGLLVICVVGLFVGGMSISDEKGAEKNKEQKEEASAEASQPNKSEQSAAASGKLTPELASNFITWWLNSAMDYNAQTAAQNHQQAFQWMTPEAANSFQASFWTPQIAESVAHGSLVAAFQPAAVQAQAINPDGSIVVGVNGSIVIQTGAQPTVQQFTGSFLVKQDKDGLRVAGLEARTGAVPGSTVY